MPPGTGGWGDGYQPEWIGMTYPERVAEAKSLLQQAGYGPDNPLKLELSYNTSENHKRIAVAIQSMWKQLGVQAELVNREVKVHYDELKENNFDVARAAWVSDYNDPQNFLYLLETRTGVQNYGRYSNPEYDALMVAQGQERDPKARLDIMKQAERIAMSEDAWLPIYYYVSKILVSQKVEGYVDNTKQVHRSRWVSIKE